MTPGTDSGPHRGLEPGPVHSFVSLLNIGEGSTPPSFSLDASQSWGTFSCALRGLDLQLCTAGARVIAGV